MGDALFHKLLGGHDEAATLVKARSVGLRMERDGARGEPLLDFGKGLAHKARTVSHAVCEREHSADLYGMLVRIVGAQICDGSSVFPEETVKRIIVYTVKVLADDLLLEQKDLCSGTHDLIKLGGGELVEKFDVTGAAVSRHLSVLKEADLIRDFREGKFIFYELNTSVLEEVLLWLGGLKGEKHD